MLRSNLSEYTVSQLIFARDLLLRLLRGRVFRENISPRKCHYRHNVHDLLSPVMQSANSNSRINVHEDQNVKINSRENKLIYSYHFMILTQRKSFVHPGDRSIST